MTEAYQEALAAMDAGTVEGLRRVLATHPEVVREREVDHSGVYSGYFAHATLLHHVAGNPIRGPLPANIIEIARALIEAGADVATPCGGGPAQPDTGDGDLMGLVASTLANPSGRTAYDLAVHRGFREIIDLLKS
jgi:hypothetical protein